MRRSAREKLAELRRKTSLKQEQMSLEDMMLLLLDGGRPREKREALKTQRDFIFDPAPVKGYKGPKGSGKSNALVAAVWLRCLLKPGSSHIVARAHYNDLMLTTFVRAEQMLKRLPPGILLDRDKAPPQRWYIQSIPLVSPEGDVIDDRASEIKFTGLQDEKGSYEASSIAVDEANEVELTKMTELLGLLRGDGLAEETRTTEDYALMFAFNPTDTHHWLYEFCTGKDHRGKQVSKPKAKLFESVAGENQRNLPKNYYGLMASGMTADQQQRLVKGDWGTVFEGQPVLREFKYEFHGKQNLVRFYDPAEPLIRAMDFGYNSPYILWAQHCEGRLLRFLEHQGTKIEIKPFIRNFKQIESERFPYHKGGFINVGDPAARQKKDTGSTLQALGEEGIQLRYRVGLTIEEGLRQQRELLNQVAEGEPMSQFDIDGCPILCAALRGGYHLDDSGQKPVKDGFYDHSADTDRYLVTNCGGVHLETPFHELPSSLAYDRAYDSF